MKYIVIRTTISLEDEVPNFSSCDTQLLNERHSAVYEAMRMYREDIDGMESIACLESSYYQHSPDNETIVEAKIYGKFAVSIIIVRAIGEAR